MTVTWPGLVHDEDVKAKVQSVHERYIDMQQ